MLSKKHSMNPLHDIIFSQNRYFYQSTLSRFRDIMKEQHTETNLDVLSSDEYIEKVRQRSMFNLATTGLFAVGSTIVSLEIAPMISPLTTYCVSGIGMLYYHFQRKKYHREKNIVKRDMCTSKYQIASGILLGAQLSLISFPIVFSALIATMYFRSEKFFASSRFLKYDNLIRKCVTGIDLLFIGLIPIASYMIAKKKILLSLRIISGDSNALMFEPLLHSVLVFGLASSLGHMVNYNNSIAKLNDKDRKRDLSFDSSEASISCYTSINRLVLTFGYFNLLKNVFAVFGLA